MCVQFFRNQRGQISKFLFGITHMANTKDFLNCPIHIQNMLQTCLPLYLSTMVEKEAIWSFLKTELTKCQKLKIKDTRHLL